MLRRVVVPLDGSSFAEAALPFAADIAHRIGGRVDLVTVHHPMPPMEVSPAAAGEIDGILREQEEVYLKDQADRVARGFGVPVAATVLDGPVVTALTEDTIANPAQLVVMTTHGRGGISRAFLGSTGDRLVRELHCPVLLMRPGEKLAERTPSEPTRVLLPLDGSALAESAVDQVLALYPPATTVLQLVRVALPMPLVAFPIPVYPPPGDAEALERELLLANRYLHEIARVLRQPGLTVHSEVVTHENPAAAILEYAERHGSDVIAIATRGFGGFDRVLLGSVADKVIRGAKIPVLAWNPQVGASSQVLAGAPETEAVRDSPRDVPEAAPTHSR
jgi:nucleotide-binding universal stress UspA family protein